MRVRKPFFPSLVFALTLTGPVFAQSTRKPPEPDRSVLDVKPGSPAVKTSELDRKPVDPWLRLPRYILHDQKAIWTSPFHTSRSDAKWWAIFGGAAAGLIPADKHIAGALPNSNTQVSIATWTSRIGAAYTLGALDGAFYVIGLKTHNNRLRETGFLGAEALANCLLVQVAVKAVTRRERPLEGDGRGHFWTAGHTLGAGSSFPSGHAMETWTFASVLAHEYPRPLIVPLAAYGLAATVCVSRLGARKHFTSDVVVGAAMGWFIGDFVYAKRHNENVDRPPSRISRVLSHVHFGGAAN